MGWEFWIVPILGVAVLIVGLLLKGGDKERGAKMAGAKQRGPANDLERFLEEVNRRRREVEKQAPSPIVEDPLRPRPAKPPRRRPVEERRPPAEEIPVALPIAPESPPPPRVIAAPPPPAVFPARVADFRHMLRSPEGLRAAFLLQEVLGPPLARRRR